MIDALKSISQKSWFLLALVALAQILALVWMVAGRVTLLSSGREVVLKTVPVDPRSLFRGDYVRLGYKISLIEGTDLPPKLNATRNKPIYITMRVKGRKPAELVTVSQLKPASLKPDEVVIRGLTTNTWRIADDKRHVRIRYGIERYYVPEGEGKRLERMVGKNNFAVLVAVARNGEAAIKGLMINGKLQYEEPLF